MKNTSFLVLATAFLASSAAAMPVVGLGQASVSQIIEVKIICEETGFCFKRGRKPVARWVYGESAFYGPYVGPGTYGNPRYRHSWWPQGWW